MENFAVIIPTRGDRPKFLAQCKKLINKQTVQPKEIFWMDYAPESQHKDISQRYKRGVEKAKQGHYEFVVFMEDDDWYHPQYLEWLIKSWKSKNKPDFFGVGETYYYHHKIDGLQHMKHTNRTSMFCTLAKLPWKISWPQDFNPFLDMHISKNANVSTVMFPKGQAYAIGIKHGIGKTGGGGHNASHNYKLGGNRKWFYDQVTTDRNFYDSMLDEMKEPVSGTSKFSIKIQRNNIPKFNVTKNRKIITTNSPHPQLSKREFKVKPIRR